MRAKTVPRKPRKRKKQTARAKFLDNQTRPKYERILGVDASTTGVAATLLVNGKPQTVVKLSLKSADIHERMVRVKKWFPKVLEHTKPDFVIIESPYLSINAQTTMKLSFMVGIILGEVLIKKIPVTDVGPSTWKKLLGYKMLTKAWQNQIIKELGATEGRKEIARLRKSQIQDIMRERFPAWSWDDDDEADSCGVALYGYQYYGKWQDKIKELIK